MANEQNLRPPFSPKEAREMGSKGGKAVTDKKRFAQRWRQFKIKLKLGKIDFKNPKWIDEITDNQKSYAIELLRDFDQIAEMPLKERTFLKGYIMDKIHGKPSPLLNIQTDNGIGNVQINFITYNDKNRLRAIEEAKKSP